MEFVLRPQDFLPYERFYGRPECREVVYRLYRSVCQGCRADLRARVDFVTGHIVARRHARVFEELFPGLEVDNLLNLHLLCNACNVRQSAFHFESAFFLNQVFKESARAIDLRYEKVLAELAPTALMASVAKIEAELPAIGKILRRAADDLTQASALTRREQRPIIPLDEPWSSRLIRLSEATLFHVDGRALQHAANFHPWVVVRSRDLYPHDEEQSGRPLLLSLKPKVQALVREQLDQSDVAGVVARVNLRGLVRLAKRGLNEQVRFWLEAAAKFASIPGPSDSASHRVALQDNLRRLTESMAKNEEPRRSLDRLALLESTERRAGWYHWSGARLDSLVAKLETCWGKCRDSSEGYARLADELMAAKAGFSLATTEVSAVNFPSSVLLEGLCPEIYEQFAGGHECLWVHRSFFLSSEPAPVVQTP